MNARVGVAYTVSSRQPGQLSDTLTVANHKSAKALRMLLAVPLYTTALNVVT